jgi:hypothetical protein
MIDAVTTEAAHYTLVITLAGGVVAWLADRLGESPRTGDSESP